MKRLFGFRIRTLLRAVHSGTLLISLLVFIQTPVANAEISYENAGRQATNLTSATMITANFDTLDLGNYTSQTIALPSIGTIARTNPGNSTYLVVGAANQFGGAGGTGRFITLGDATLTLTETRRYVGFWWSAGNSPNNVTVNLQNGSTETFNAGTLSTALGTCGTSAYCDNPNTGIPDRDTNQLYAYVHIRNEVGFNSIRFEGAGFELDNISVSTTVPDRVSTESTFSSQTVRTDCSSITSTDATNNTRACPRTITISTGTASEYNPLLESQIAGYSYPNTVSVTNSDINSGVGSESRNGNVITLSSTTVGTFTVNFSIRNSSTGGTDTSRITVIVETVIARLPSILYVDPQEVSKKLPIPPISGGTNITLCTSQVSDGSGGALGSANTIEIVRGSNTSGVTRSSGNNLVTYSGTQANINTQLSTLSVQGVSNAVVVNGASKFIRIVVTPTSSAVSNLCSTGVSQNIEIKPLELGKTRLVDMAVS